jgi:transposase-like protein
MWSEEEKRRIVAETLEPGSSVSIVARRHDLNANLLFTWRRKMASASDAERDTMRLVPAVIAPEPAPAAAPKPAASTCTRVVAQPHNGHVALLQFGLAMTMMRSGAGRSWLTVRADDTSDSNDIDWKAIRGRASMRAPHMGIRSATVIAPAPKLRMNHYSTPVSMPGSDGGVLQRPEAPPTAALVWPGDRLETRYRRP